MDDKSHLNMGGIWFVIGLFYMYMYPKDLIFGGFFAILGLLLLTYYYLTRYNVTKLNSEGSNVIILQDDNYEKIVEEIKKAADRETYMIKKIVEANKDEIADKSI